MNYTGTNWEEAGEWKSGRQEWEGIRETTANQPAWCLAQAYKSELADKCKKPNISATKVELQKVKLFVAQLCLTLRNPMDCSPPVSSVHGILQARILEWVAMPSSRGSSWSRSQTSCTAGRFFTSELPGGLLSGNLLPLCSSCFCESTAKHLVVGLLPLLVVKASRQQEESAVEWGSRGHTDTARHFHTRSLRHHIVLVF